MANTLLAPRATRSVAQYLRIGSTKFSLYRRWNARGGVQIYPQRFSASTPRYICNILASAFSYSTQWAHSQVSGLTQVHFGFKKSGLNTYLLICCTEQPGQRRANPMELLPVPEVFCLCCAFRGTFLLGHPLTQSEVILSPCQG